MIKLLINLILLIGFINCDSDFYDYGESSESNVPSPSGRILGSLFKGWKGDDDVHPLTEFGKIHIVSKRPNGWGHNDHGGGWGWNQYGPKHTTYHITKKYKSPIKKKSWLKIPKKSFGIHVKGGVGFSFGGNKKKGHGQTVVVEHSPGWGGWGWGQQQNNYGWGWNDHGHGHHDGHYDGGDYYDDDGGNNKEESNEDHQDDEEVSNEHENENDDDDDERKRRKDLSVNDYFKDDYAY